MIFFPDEFAPGEDLEPLEDVVCVVSRFGWQPLHLANAKDLVGV